MPASTRPPFRAAAPRTARDRALAECLAGARALHDGKTAAGLKRYTTATALAPRDAEIAALHGVALRDAGRMQDAQRELIRALALDPQRAETYAQLGQTYWQICDYAQAATALRAAATLKQTDALLWRDTAETLKRAGQLSEAVAIAAHAFSLAPKNPRVANVFALVLHHTGRVEDALAICAQIPADDVTDTDFLLTHGMLLRTYGAYERGWALQEHRHARPEFRARPNAPASPKWDGTPLAGRHILVRGEQGMGDQIQFLRWATTLRALGAREVTVQCAAPLQRLFQTAAHIDALIAADEIAPPHDVHVDIMSLPFVLQSGSDFRPDLVPYLRVPDSRHTLPDAAFTGRPGTLRLGLVWGGTPLHADDASRSIPLALLDSILQRDDVTIVVLQHGPSRTQLDALPPALREECIDVTAQMGDMGDTAELIRSCDAVLTVDTSVAHLAGAIDMPTWIMVAHPAEWRWGRQRSDSAWYPSVRLLRQHAAGDWSSVVQQAHAQIDAALARGRR